MVTVMGTLPNRRHASTGNLRVYCSLHFNLPFHVEDYHSAGRLAVTGAMQGHAAQYLKLLQ
jgi:hypothetical protein